MLIYFLVSMFFLVLMLFIVSMLIYMFCFYCFMYAVRPYKCYLNTVNLFNLQVINSILNAPKRSLQQLTLVTLITLFISKIYEIFILIYRLFTKLLILLPTAKIYSHINKTASCKFLLKIELTSFYFHVKIYVNVLVDCFLFHVYCDLIVSYNCNFNWLSFIFLFLVIYICHFYLLYSSCQDYFRGNI